MALAGTVIGGLFVAAGLIVMLLYIALMVSGGSGPSSVGGRHRCWFSFEHAYVGVILCGMTNPSEESSHPPGASYPPPSYLPPQYPPPRWGAARHQWQGDRVARHVDLSDGCAPGPVGDRRTRPRCDGDA